MPAPSDRAPAFDDATSTKASALPIVGLVSIALGLPIRDGEDEATQSVRSAEASSA